MYSRQRRKYTRNVKQTNRARRYPDRHNSGQRLHAPCVRSELHAWEVLASMRGQQPADSCPHYYYQLQS